MTYDDEKDDELEMFIEAQDTVWRDVLSELQAGEKAGQWMWFVFPQLAELGQSYMSQLYGLESLTEAEAYLGHDELQRRLLVVSALMLEHADKGADSVLGNIDAQKLKSCMTLFAAVPNAPPIFQQVLDALFDGAPCAHTVAALNRT